MLQNEKTISSKLKDKKVTKIKVEGLKLSGRFNLWEPINFETLACSYFFILLLSSHIFWIRDKQQQRITWKPMHW